ncbi:LTA synthase family protein, partial [Paenibacillus darwinianus]
MLSALRTAARRGVHGSFRMLERTRGADMVLFFVLMTHKLSHFNIMLDVRNMELTPDDVLIAVGTLALVSFWTVWLSYRWRLIVLAALNLILTAVLYSDLVYFRYFQDIISLPVLLQAGQVGSLGGSIASLLSWRDIAYFADWLLIIPLAVYALFSGRRPKELTFRAPKRVRMAVLRLSFSLIVFAAGLTLVFVPVNAANQTWAKGLFTNNWWNVSVYNVTGLYGFHGYDIYRSVKASTEEKALTVTQQQTVMDWFGTRGSLRASLAENDKPFGAYKGKNVVMVQAEAFQNFVIGRSIGGVEITPNLNRLMKESIYFNRFYHQTSQGRTSDADFAAQCSQQPLPSGSVFIRYADHTFDCLPGALKAEGYGTSVFHAYEGGFWNRHAMYTNMQYDVYYNKKHFQLDEPVGWSLGDKSFFRQSADRISGQKQPFYSFLITLSSHHPYKLPASMEKLDVGEFQGSMFGDYLQSVNYTDAALGEFIARLKAEGLWDETIFIFYGDHDNSIRDWEPFERFLGQKLNPIARQQILKQVPLIVRLPDGALGGTVRSDVGGQLDITPTILHLLGVDSSKLAMLGTPLVTDTPLPGKTVVFRNGSLTDGAVYYLPSAAA